MAIPPRPRFIVNDDGDGLKLVPPPHSPAQVAGPIAYLQNTPVDGFCLCVGEEVASFRSRTTETIYDIYDRGTATHGEFTGANDLCHALYRQGIDYLPLIIGHAHAAGMAFYASLRMNDTHHKSHPAGVLAPEFWKQHPEYRLWGATDGKSYYNAGMDWAFPEIRRRKLDLIAELAETYPVDGVELDFSRTPYLFQPDQAWANRELLTEFLREVRRRFDAIGRAQGRKVNLMLRTVFREARLQAFGMDLRTWIGERLPDLLVLTDLVNSFDVPVEPWLTLCRQHDIPLYPAVEAGPATDRRNFHDLITNPETPPHNFVVRQTAEEYALTRRAVAQHWLAQGVAGVYLFNYADRPIADVYFDPHGARPPLSHGELATLDTLLGRDKRYLYWHGLPLYVEALRPPQYHQTIQFPTFGGDIGRPGSRVTLRFRQVAQPFPHVASYRQNPCVPPGYLTYTLNGVDLAEAQIRRTRQKPGRIPSGFRLKTHEQIEIELPGESLKPGLNTLAFAIRKSPSERDPYVYVYEFEVDVRFPG